MGSLSEFCKSFFTLSAEKSSKGLSPISLGSLTPLGRTFLRSNKIVVPSGKRKLAFLKNQRGQGLLEYIVLVALIGVATMGMVRILQSSIKANFANVIFALQDDSRRKVSAEKISEEDLKKADFGDFMNGASSKSKE